MEFQAVEEDVFSTDQNLTLIDHVLDTWDELNVIIEFVFVFCAICASVFLIVVFVKFKQIQKPIYAPLLHYSICTTLNSVSTPFFYYTIYFFPGPINTVLWCMGVHIEQSSCLLIFLFATLTTVHWYWKLIDLKNSDKFLKYATIAFYLFGLAEYASSAHFCAIESYFYSPIVSQLTYVSCVITVAVMNFKGRRHQNYSTDRNRYVLVIGTFILVNWLPLLALHFAFYYFEYHGMLLRTMLVFIMDLPNLITVVQPVIVVILLRHYLKDFKIVMDRVFNMVKKSYTSGEDLDEELDVENGDIDQD